MAQAMTSLQIYLFIAPMVLFAVAAAIVWLIRPRNVCIQVNDIMSLSVEHCSARETQAMTPLQIYLLATPFVLLAGAALVVWLTRPRDRLHPSE